uniref:Putative ovule protein n=1 Tax=Solanum chacoense TaxID=4108 RepID=A0A0V0HGE6_SOLCH
MNMDGFTQYPSSTPQYPPQTPLVRTILFPHELNTRLRVLRHSTFALFNHAIDTSDQLSVLSKKIKKIIFYSGGI